MKISYNWLKNYLHLELPAQQIAEILTDIGLEVEDVIEVESIKGGLKGVVVGHVLAKSKHPNADRLSVTQVDIGNDAPLQIVCGASNVDVGQKVAVATIGTTLFFGEDPIKIKKGNIRGEISEGMICAEDELGLGTSHDGIMVLDKDTKIGINASDYFGLESDFVFEIGLTPNRTDAMSHIGVARDLMTALNHKGGNLKLCLPTVDNFQTKNTSKTITVEVKDHTLCPRYSGISIKGVTITDSPNWLKNKLKAIGISPINNVVDITNFVLHETGQPLHAFDLAKMVSNTIVVDRATENTKLTTLDHIERTLSADDLTINNKISPMCIAGVLGGLESAISASTKEIFLESAFFDAISIRKTSKRHMIHSEASFRFERGCDPNMTLFALKRAALLITEICGGEIASDLIDIYPNKIEDFSVQLSFIKMDALIGEHLDRSVVKNILQDLGIQITSSTENELNLRIPPFKADVQREADVIEEILRIYGYNTIQIPEKLNTALTESKAYSPEFLKSTISNLLSDNGFSETINNSLSKCSYTQLISDLREEENVILLNPLSSDLNILRQSLIFGALENVVYNQNRKNSDLKLYEFGKTYHKTENGHQENQHLLLLITGKTNYENWNSTNKNTDFFFLKEKVEHILNRLGINHFSTNTIHTGSFSTGLSYNFRNKNLVCLGKLNTNLCKAFDLKSEIYVADLNWDFLLELAGFSKTTYKEISKFPEVRRDLSLLINENITFEQLEEIAFQSNKKLLKKVHLFDVYEGDKIPNGMKSYALSFLFGDETRTLTDKDVDEVMQKLIQSFSVKTGAEIRSS